MFTKKWLALGMALIMVCVLAACGEKAGEDSQRQSPNTSGQSASNSNQPPDPVTFTYFNAGASRKDVVTNETEIGKIHYERTGVAFKIEHLVGDVQTKIGTMIASGEYPDVLVPDTEIDKVVENGGFIPLNDLIEQHAPNIKRVYGPYMNVMKHTDGNIYFLPFSPQVGEFIPNPVIDQGAFWIQHRVLKEFDYPEIKTLDEYFDLIRRYVQNHPNENLTGFTALTDDWRFFVITNPANHLAGYPNDGTVQVDLKTLEANDYNDDEGTRRWLKALNDLYHEGLFDKTSFINNYDQYLAKLTTGEVLGFFDYGWQINQAMQNLKAAGDGDLEYMPLPIVFDANIKDQYIEPPAFVNNRGIGITKSAKDPVRIIKFFDYLLEEENQILNQWGIEGVTYEVAENGRFYRTKEQVEKLFNNEYKQQVGLTYFEYYWPMYSQASTASSGNAISPGRQPEVAQLTFTEAEKQFLEKYGVQTFSEMFAAPDDRPWYPAWSIALEQGSPAQLYNQQRDDLMKKHFPRIVLAEPGQFDKEWNEYVTEFNKLNVKAFEETMTQLIKEKVKHIRGE